MKRSPIPIERDDFRLALWRGHLALVFLRRQDASGTQGRDGLATIVNRKSRIFFVLSLLCVLFLGASCSKKPDTGEDDKVTTLGSIEVTAQLLEIRGKIIDDPLYDYAHVMKYKILKVHRGKLNGDIIYVGHYNPAEPRSSVADARVPRIGGNLKRFRAMDIHRMALEVPIDDYYMGGIINKYFGESKDPIYWAVWTNLVTK
jgi:hypothetical protein